MEPAGPNFDVTGLPRLAATPVQAPRIAPPPKPVIAPTVLVTQPGMARPRKKHPIALTLLTLLLMAGCGLGAWFVVRVPPPEVHYSLQVAVANIDKIDRVAVTSEGLESDRFEMRIDMTTRMVALTMEVGGLGPQEVNVDIDTGDAYMRSEDLPLYADSDTPWVRAVGDGPIALISDEFSPIEVSSRFPPVEGATRGAEEFVGTVNCVHWSVDDPAPDSPDAVMVYDFWVDADNHIRRLTISTRSSDGVREHAWWEYTAYDDDVEPVERPGSGDFITVQPPPAEVTIVIP